VSRSFHSLHILTRIQTSCEDVSPGAREQSFVRYVKGWPSSLLSLISSASVAQAARAVVDADGLKGLFGRGLKTRIIANGLQGLLFSILWKLFLDLCVSSPKLHH
jgi:hypothetical protein